MQDFLSLRGNIGRETPRLSLVSTITRSSEGLGGELTNYLLTTRYSQTSHDFSNIVYFTRLLDRDQDQSRSPKMTRRPDVGSSSRTEMESAQPEIRRPAPVLHPENSCCFCLTLRSGTAIISILHSIFYLGLIIWSVRYFTSNKYTKHYCTGEICRFYLFVVPYYIRWPPLQTLKLYLEGT